MVIASRLLNQLKQEQQVLSEQEQLLLLEAQQLEADIERLCSGNRQLLKTNVELASEESRLSAMLSGAKAPIQTHSPELAPA
jgi:hypothetical protein